MCFFNNFTSIRALVFTLFIVFTSIEMYSQKANKVHHYGELTTEQQRLQKIQEDITKTSAKISELYKKYNINHPGKRGFGTSDKNVIDKIIGENENLLTRINSSGIKNLETKLQTLYYKKGSKKTENKILAIEKAAIININNAKKRLAELNDKESTDKLEQEKHKKEINLINDKIKNLDAIISKRTKEIKSNNKTRSLDDFLKTRKTVTAKNDFLRNKKNTTHKNSTDFLSKEDKENSDMFNSKKINDSDFLNSNKTTLQGKIEYKNGKTGVVGKNGKILIPFRNWNIVAYKNGIAQISTRLDSFECGKSCVGFYNATVYKTGFVDSSGNYLDGIQITSSGKWKSDACIQIIRAGVDDTKTITQERRAKEYEETKYRLAKSKCINEGQEWELNTINKFK